jgi:DNA-binding transcriptional LysR family regulator
MIAGSRQRALEIPAPLPNETSNRQPATVMEIRQLEAFVAVADTGSFTAAGDRVNLTQSTISQQIKALEEELGEALFLRGKRSTQLTEAGERLMPHARLILGTLDEIAAAFRASGRAPRGRIRVGASAMAAAYLLGPLYEGFIKAYPDIQVVVRATSTTDETVRQVTVGEIDVGFIAVPVTNQALAVEPVATDEIVLVVGKDHAWAHRRSVRAAELDGAPFVAFERGLSHRQTMDDLLGKVGVTPRVIAETNDPITVKNFVEAGLGIALVPRWSVAAEAETGRLHLLTLEGHSLVRDVNMIYLKRHTSAVRAFVEFCRRGKKTIRRRAKGEE